MNLMDMLRQRAQEPVPERDDSAVSLDVDEDGKRLFADDIVAFVRDQLQKRQDARRTLETQWVLNANFKAGHQNCDINAGTGEIEDYVPMYDHLERGIYNKIAPLIQTRIANLRTVKYDMTVRPRTEELDDYEKAQVSTKLLRYTQDMLDFDGLMDTAYQWSALTGTAFFYSWWDANRGEDIGSGVTEGDLSCGLLTPYEVYPEDLYREKVSDQRSVLVEQILPVGDVYDIYGVRVPCGDSISTYTMMPAVGAGGNGYENVTYRMERTVKEDAVRVLTYFERRSRRYQQGRMIVVIGEQLFSYGALPYKEIPIVAVKDQIVEGQFFGKSVIQDLIPYQRAYNGVKNKIHDYIQTVAANPIAVAEGSTDVDDLVDNGIPPGKVLAYNPNRGGPPVAISYPELPGTVLAEEQKLISDMEYTAGVSQLMVVGAAPSGVTSGTAIDNLRQIDNTRLSLTAESFRTAVKSLAKMWLRIYKDWSSNYRVLRTAGLDDSGAVLTWCVDDINSFDVEFDTENELKNSEDNQKANFLQAWQMGVFADENGVIPREFRRRAWEMLKIGNLSDMVTEDDLQRKNAQRENTYFGVGSVPKVDELDDHEIHVAEHRRFALGMQFRLLEKKSPEYAAALRAHIKDHESILAQKAAQQMAQAAAQMNMGG